MEKNILCWNVAGIRACHKKGGLSIVKDYDIVCFQESKCERDQFKKQSEELSEFPYKYWHATLGRKGLHGTSIWSKEEPHIVTYGLPNGEDTEGRVITAEYGSFVIVTNYTPNSKADLSRLEERTKKWDVAYKEYVDSIKKPVILCGDFNVAHKDIDIYSPAGMERYAGFTPEERLSFNKLATKYIDIHRYNNPEKEKEFTFWPYTVPTARTKNMGWRLDYFLVSQSLVDKVKETKIIQEQKGSDHCPISMKIK